MDHLHRVRNRRFENQGLLSFISVFQSKEVFKVLKHWKIIDYILQVQYFRKQLIVD